ncbi:MAG: nucleotidyltransferase domain-containing protein [Clostridium sp.]|jgi:predicted nucleotidyltransferase|nr:nucleotidyltransferase domain-containing protein [Clostridium sp.]
MRPDPTVINTVSKYADVVTKQFSPAAMLLGSYAKSEANDESDMDVAVVFNGFSGDWLKASSLLWRMRRGISYDIERHLLDTAADKRFYAPHFKIGQMIDQA